MTGEHFKRRVAIDLVLIFLGVTLAVMWWSGADRTMQASIGLVGGLGVVDLVYTLLKRRQDSQEP